MRTTTTLGTIALVAALASGCAGDARVNQAQVLPAARDCAASLPPFRITFAEGLYRPSGAMRTSNDGGWCSLLVGFDYGTPSRMVVVQAPAHGALEIFDVTGGARFSYRPAPRFQGADRFSVQAEVGGRSWIIPVAVAVTPDGPGAGGAGEGEFGFGRGGGAPNGGGGGVGARG